MTDRRTFLHGTSVLMGHAALSGLLAACATSTRSSGFFSSAELATLRAVVDCILPETDSPAASAAKTHLFIDLALPQCATPQAQSVFRRVISDWTQQQFSSWPLAQQVAKLTAQAQADMALPYEQSFFKMLKDYTLTGYFLSETGATQALAYDPVPGGYWGDLPLLPNQKAWTL